MLVAAAVVVVFGGMAVASPVLGWMLTSVFFAIVCGPIYNWLQRRGVPSAVALTVIALLLTGIVLGLVAMVAASAAGFIANASTYQDLLAARLAGANDALRRLGLTIPADAMDRIANPGAIISWLLWLLGAITGAASSYLYILLLTLFLLVDGPAMMARMRAGLGDDHPIVVRLAAVGPNVVRGFGIRAYVNVLTGAGSAVAFWLIGVDFALLWGVLIFFLSFVPNIGIFIAAAPPVALALAEFGIWHALLVIVGITVVNLGLENLVMPRLLGASLSMAPSVVFAAFFFWTWLLGGSGALLAGFLTVLVIVVLDSYPETRWLAGLLRGESAEDASSGSPEVVEAATPVAEA